MTRRTGPAGVSTRPVPTPDLNDPDFAPCPLERFNDLGSDEVFEVAASG
jgi:hypothetical protein